SATPDPAALLALITLDRAHYERAFVLDYPTTRDALSIDYGSEFARAHVVPSGELFPIATLGEIATRDDGNDAFEKLLSGVAATDGRIGEAYRARARIIIGAVPPAKTIDAFAALPLPARLAAIATLGWCSPRPTALLAFQPTPEPVPTLQTTASPLATGAAPAASRLLSATPPRRPAPTLAQVTAIQESIGHAVTYDCSSAQRAAASRHHKGATASAHMANRKTASPTPHSH
ncbi:MAG: hypothetical protein IAI50_21045, partial [Candidatus Eremiobacteraeota bacterium]|nr:hypothetical protein [Candidatus Eremiobacteraeota bacterium]